MRPFLFQLGAFHVDTYWVMIILGGVVSALFWRAKRARMGLSTDQQFWLLLDAIVIGAFVGGRLVHMLVWVPWSAPGYWDMAFSWGQGFSILGDVLGGTAGVLWFCRAQKVAFPRLFDYLCAMIPAWDFFGRFGCLSAGCCYGRPAGVPWAVRFYDPRSQVPREWLGTPLHPTQLYEALGNVLILLALHRLVLPRVEAGRWPRGSVAAAYFGLYGVMRFTDEFFRGDVALWRIGLTGGQVLSLGFLALSAGALVRLRREAR